MQMNAGGPRRGGATVMHALAPDASDDELLELVRDAMPPGKLGGAEIVAAGRLAWTWRNVTAEIAGCLDVSTTARPPLL